MMTRTLFSVVTVVLLASSLAVRSAGCASGLGSPSGDASTDLLVVKYDPEIEAAIQISKADMLRNRAVKGGAVGFTPDGNYNGIWLTDSMFQLEAYRYWGPEYRDFLYPETPGSLGLVPRFAGAQDTDGLIPMVFWGNEGKVDYGGLYDLAQNRKQNRDMESPYTFVHVNYMYWKDTGDLTYLRKYRDAMRRALQPIDNRRDVATGLILMSYGFPNCDVSVDYALPRTTESRSAPALRRERSFHLQHNQPHFH